MFSNRRRRYAPLYAANRADLGLGLLRLLEARVPNLRANVPPRLRDNGTLAGAQGHTGYSLLQDPHWHHANDSCVVPGTAAPTCFVQPPSFLGDLVWASAMLWRHYEYSVGEQDTHQVLRRAFTLVSSATNFCAKNLVLG